jgi:hypothetical protein
MRGQATAGRRTDAIDALVEADQRVRPAHEEELAQIARPARLLSTAGLTVLPHPVARVVRALADAGVRGKPLRVARRKLKPPDEPAFLAADES